MDLGTSYRRCARITRRRARNFYFAFRSLPQAERHAVYALYAFCREADDAADSDAPVAAKRGALSALRRRLAQAAEGAPESAADAALADTIRRFAVDAADLEDVIDGVEMDLDPPRLETFADLRHYCYHVAAAVGLATLPVLAAGASLSDEMRDAAVALGLGMQLVNVLRDIEEDLARGRIYLPKDLLLAHGVPRDAFAKRQDSPALRAALRELGARARTYLDHGRRLPDLLPKGRRACPRLLSEIYGRILDRIERDGYVPFRARVGLPTAEKLWLLASAAWRDE